MIPERNHRLCSPAYMQMFYNLQLSGYYILYYEFDFSKQKIVNMSKFMMDYDNQIVDGRLDKLALDEKWEKRGYDVQKMADRFPHRSKLAMTELKKIKSSRIVDVLASASMAVKYYLEVATYTLREKYRFSWSEIERWWQLVLDFVPLFSDHHKKGDGMKAQHILKYFKQEADLDIEL